MTLAEKTIYLSLKEKLDNMIAHPEQYDDEYIEGYTICLTDFQKATERKIRSPWKAIKAKLKEILRNKENEH